MQGRDINAALLKGYKLKSLCVFLHRSYISIMNTDFDLILTSDDSTTKSTYKLLPLFQMLLDKSLDNVAIYTPSGDKVYKNSILFKILNISDVKDIADDQ